jgi:hypothetical protein
VFGASEMAAGTLVGPASSSTPGRPRRLGPAAATMRAPGHDRSVRAPPAVLPPHAATGATGTGVPPRNTIQDTSKARWFS